MRIIKPRMWVITFPCSQVTRLHSIPDRFQEAWIFEKDCRASSKKTTQLDLWVSRFMVKVEILHWSLFHGLVEGRLPTSSCSKNSRFDPACITEPVTKLEELVREKFSLIKNKCVEALRFPGSPCSSEHLKVGIHPSLLNSLHRDKTKRRFMKNWVFYLVPSQHLEEGLLLVIVWC